LSSAGRPWLRVADGIAASGLTIRDALLDGFGMGLLPPSIGTRETPHDNDPWTFEAGQTVVVQPSVVTRDQPAGVQTGELCVVTTSGCSPSTHSRGSSSGSEYGTHG
jgi:Xaa-Pro dipeptidase